MNSRMTAVAAGVVALAAFTSSGITVTTDEHASLRTLQERSIYTWTQDGKLTVTEGGTVTSSLSVVAAAAVRQMAVTVAAAVVARAAFSICSR